MEGRKGVEGRGGNQETEEMSSVKKQGTFIFTNDHEPNSIIPG